MTNYTAEILRDTALLLAAVFVAVFPRSPLSVDAALTAGPSGHDTDPADDPGPDPTSTLTSARAATAVPPLADQEGPRP